jgi:uncharacterized membrane protein
MVDRGILHFSHHWLTFTNLLAFLFIAPALAAPYLLSQGQGAPANVIYFVYHLTCHQMPSRSFFIFGQKMAFCERDLAIYATVLVAGLVFGLVRRQLKPLNWKIFLLLILPMAVDGFSQLFGLRESTWELRLITGALFGGASVWLFYPFLEQGMAEVCETLEERFSRANVDW